MHGRTAAAKSARRLRHRQRMTPKFLALQVVANQSARSEIAHHALAVRRERGRGRAALGGVKLLQLLRLSPLVSTAACRRAAGSKASPACRRRTPSGKSSRATRTATTCRAARRFSKADSCRDANSIGGLADSETPEPFGPRNCGHQVSAALAGKVAHDRDRDQEAGK